MATLEQRRKALKDALSGKSDSELQRLSDLTKTGVPGKDITRASKDFLKGIAKGKNIPSEKMLEALEHLIS